MSHSSPRKAFFETKKKLRFEIISANNHYYKWNQSVNVWSLSLYDECSEQRIGQGSTFVFGLVTLPRRRAFSRGVVIISNWTANEELIRMIIHINEPN
jgi:hypothetical protein